MAANLQRIVAEKNLVEIIMNLLEQGTEVVTSLVRLALDNEESKEAAFMKEQFQKVREQFQRIDDEKKKSDMDIVYFSFEENIRNQFRMYIEFLNAKPKFHEVKKNEFLKHFGHAGGDKNLHTLYNAVTGENFSEESVLKITLNHNEKNRRVMEDFCARLKELFCIGIIALLGYTDLKDLGKEQILKDWKEKMKAVQVTMTAVIEVCIVSFAKQAEVDCRRFVRDHSEMTNKELADALIELLKKKYDWVYWSVRIFKTPTGLFANKKDFHCLFGNSRFQVPSSDEKLNIMVSYSASPEPIDKLRIQDLILNQKKSTVVGVAEMLFETLPGSNMVHTVENTKDLACSSSFTSELHYWVEHNNFFVCAHSA